MIMYAPLPLNWILYSKCTDFFLIRSLLIRMVLSASLGAVDAVVAMLDTVNYRGRCPGLSFTRRRPLMSMTADLRAGFPVGAGRGLLRRGFTSSLESRED